MEDMFSYKHAGRVERAMKVQEVMLRALAKKITGWRAAEIIANPASHGQPVTFTATDYRHCCRNIGTGGTPGHDLDLQVWYTSFSSVSDPKTSAPKAGVRQLIILLKFSRTAGQTSGRSQWDRVAIRSLL